MSTDRPGAPELSPSDVRPDEPVAARMVGLLGLGATTLGVAAVIANQYSPRWIPVGTGYLLAVLGVVCLLYHAIRDGDIEIRRTYGGLAGLLLVGAVVLSAVPGRPATGVASSFGYYFLPWGVTCGLLGLLFTLAFLKNETDEKYRGWGEAGLLGFGVGLTVLAAALGVGTSQVAVGPVVVLGVLGLAYLCGYFSQTDTSVGIGHWVAVGLGVVGGGLLVVTAARIVFPTVLHDGPSALKRIDQSLSLWSAAVRAGVILLCLFGAWKAARSRSLPGGVRVVGALVGLGFAVGFVVGTFAAPVTVEPAGYLVPSGVVLLGLGALLLGTSVAICSEHPLVVLTRRELSAYFFSPIGYIVLIGMTLVSGLGYSIFVGYIGSRLEGLPEPMVQADLSFTWFGAFAVMALVPAVTMRSFSEEKRSGTLEVLFTAPVGEGTVVFSKFLAAWLFYLVTWLPAGLFLVALWVTGGTPFQYRTVVVCYLSVAAAGVGFVGMGLFFSSVTKNQIVAAVLTFTGMFALFLTLGQLRQDMTFLSPGVQAVLAKFDYLGLWQQSLQGLLPIPAVCAYLSFGALWLFLTVKVLEARKWS